MIKLKISISLFLFASIFLQTECFGQTRKELEQRKIKTEEEIKLTTKLLDETEQNRTAGINKILIIKKRISLREQLVNDISNEISLIDASIEQKTSNINNLENEILRLKEEYAKMIYFAYKNRSTYDKLMFILASDNFNQAYRRLKYFQQYSQYRKKQALLIIQKQNELLSEISELKEQKNQKINLLSQKENEKYQLKLEREKENTELVKLQKKEKELRKKIEDNEKVMKRLAKEINDLIAKEAEESKKRTIYTDEALSENFKSSRGKLDWPVEKGVIIRDFGEQQHPVLKGIMLNNEGIDINLAKDEKVKSIFDGEVKRVIAVPGSNMAIIIRHGHFLSFYSNLVNVRVKSGDKVKKGQHLGDIYYLKNDDKSSVLHFRIYEETKVLNPKIWLLKK
ncbi:MAG: hypothetical protein A2X13_11800 [Bacteroidetes bacterium GWC2_33_15]|nr:MAG: hypothetical protein A2X10_05825 [Bacteroidetes bacterium GWA2_33_15]OFX50821.1 MAG: hypothetical protein A2X13_11800 [Bacteroidetes bacterium GWC2_33_15]OFX62896.1 MAG: hypothetical protein A2X15_09570 [Bacteroidetes bacterium GWB2_32_14]OFX69966.1 MAG: hypothetical protein A2X14_02430 [Bacteroidetes bacterium GWD2_33_33]HAN18961.1 hypothetical protein [Bacteroidales bacterium]